MTTSRVVLVVLASLELVIGHSYHLGRCPTVNPMPDFDMTKFVGRWYALQKTSTNVRCLTNDYSTDPLALLQTMLLGVPGINHVVRYLGQLSVPDPSQSASMSVKFPLNVAGTSSYIVFMTDYNTYAGVYSCQKLAFWYRQSATILSRTTSLDSTVVHQVRQRLQQFGVNPQDLKVIRQDCPPPTEDGIHLNIRPNVFKQPNVTEVIHSALDTINDVSNVAKTGYDIYNSINAIASRKRRDAEEDEYDVNTPEGLPDWIP